jgi:hypothetical protein
MADSVKEATRSGCGWIMLRLAAVGHFADVRGPAVLAVGACGGGSPASWARVGATPARVAAKYCSTYGQGSMHVSLLAPDGSAFQPTPAELFRDGKFLQSDRRYRQIGMRVEQLGGFGR